MLIVNIDGFATKGRLGLFVRTSIIINAQAGCGNEDLHIVY